MDFTPSFGGTTQHTASWSSLGWGRPWPGKQSPPSPARRGSCGSWGWGATLSEPGPSRSLQAFSSCGYRSRLVMERLPVRPLQPLTPDTWAWLVELRHRDPSKTGGCAENRCLFPMLTVHTLPDQSPLPGGEDSCSCPHSKARAIAQPLPDMCSTPKADISGSVLCLD